MDKFVEGYIINSRLPKSCVFCQIGQAEEDNFIVYEDEQFLAFLDKRPVFLGHCLLIPKIHYDTIYDLPADLSGSIILRTQLIGRAIEQGLNVDGSFIAINNKVSQSVPHVHVHIIPRKIKDGLRGFFWPRQQYENDAQKIEIQLQIKKFISK